MELTSREAAIIAYALTTLALAKDDGINATVTELRDLSTRLMVSAK